MDSTNYHLTVRAIHYRCVPIRIKRHLKLVDGLERIKIGLRDAPTASEDAVGASSDAG